MTRRHSLTAALVAACLATAQLGSAAGGERVWISRHNGETGRAEAAALAVSPDGGPSSRLDDAAGLVVRSDGSHVYVTGSSTRGLPGNEAISDMLTVAYRSSTGARVWVARNKGPVVNRRYLGALRTSTSAKAIAGSPDGTRLLVAGSGSRWNIRGSRADATDDFLTVAYRATTGAKLWEARYNGSRGGYESASAVAVSSDGMRAYVTGPSGGALATVAYATATGKRLWVARHAGDQPVSIATAPDGSRLYVTGTGEDADGRIGFITIAYRTR